MLKRSGRALCSQNLNFGNWVTNVESLKGSPIERPSRNCFFSQSFLFFCFPSFSCSFHMASRRQSESYVCMLLPSKTLFETVQNTKNRLVFWIYTCRIIFGFALNWQFGNEMNVFLVNCNFLSLHVLLENIPRNNLAFLGEAQVL